MSHAVSTVGKVVSPLAMASSLLKPKQGTDTTTQTVTPWGPQQPYLTDLFARAQGAANSSQGQSTALFNQAASQQAAAAQDPNGLVAQAQGQLGQTLGGQYLSPTSNPYLSGAVQNALDQVRQNVNSQFRGDNYGSSANQEYLTRILANTALPIYAQNYSNERQNQLSAVGAAPDLQSANAQQLAQAGQLTAAGPFAALQNYQNLISGNFGGTTTTNTPYYTNPLGSAAGGAATGFAVGGPWGAAIGAGLGLLGSRR